MRKTQKEERTKQVQFRMTKKLHCELRKALLDDDLGMADFFNDTAEKYVKKHKKRKKAEDKNNG